MTDKMSLSYIKLIILMWQHYNPN